MKLTEFQCGILGAVNKCPNRMTDLWTAVQIAFPERWTKKDGQARSGRGALVANARRTCSNLADRGLLIMWLTDSQSFMIAIPNAFDWDEDKQELVTKKVL